MEVPIYEGNLNVEKFLYRVITLDKYFDYKENDDEKKVNHVVTSLSGHET
jgi:hypothetical protein